MKSQVLRGLALPASLLCFATLPAQQPAPPFPSPLDPARSVQPLAHTPLPEEYIWTDGDITALRADHNKYPWARQQLRTAPHLFRAHFQLAATPAHATLYIAGPRKADVFLNGHRLAHFTSNADAPIGFKVFHADAASLLHPGDNILAISAVRGRGIVSGDSPPATSQLAYGEVLAAKLTAASFGQPGPSLLLSNKAWRSAVGSEVDTTYSAAAPWAEPNFNDSGWNAVASLGSIEGNRDLMQWSSDAGMYGWPGYMGMSSPLGTYALAPAAVTHIFEGQARFEHLDALTKAAPAQPFTVLTPASAATLTDAESPSILLDFGREIAGRLLVESGSSSDAVLSIAYGESELEALATGLTPEQRGGNYLGTNLLDVPARGTARGPKSAFRFVRIRFLRGSPSLAFRSIRAEGIAYPVTYAGSFESSDPLLNRIWETGAYTVHLCMQDDLWDAPKRDRGRWAGDIDVEGRIISTAFGDKALLERTLAALAPATEGHHVNGIPNYSALWITSLASLYAHSGDLDFLRSQHDALLRVLATIDGSLNHDSVYTDAGKGWPFVDWSPGLYGNTPAATLGTNLHFLRGYTAGATLLEAIGDHQGAERARERASALRSHFAATFGAALGHGWQLNALAVESGLLESSAAQQLAWSASLAHVKQDSPEDPVISPYFNITVLDAMARLGHPREALDWMRTYWGGMLAEGATSFWESYDLRWPKDTPHLSLQADGTSGFFVSMAHGWSAGPTAWLSEQVLGIRDPADGYRTVTLAPRLLGLDWAKGAVPTPHGPISMSLRKDGAQLHLDFDLPAGVDHAQLNLEPATPGSPILLDGKPVARSPQDTTGMHLPIAPGHHTVSFTPVSL